MVLKERKNSLSFIFKAFNLSKVELVTLSWLNIKTTGLDRLKAFKIKESGFFLSSKPSIVMTLCHTLVGYLISFVYIGLNCVFLTRGSRITDATLILITPFFLT